MKNKNAAPLPRSKQPRSTMNSQSKAQRSKIASWSECRITKSIKVPKLLSRERGSESVSAVINCFNYQKRRYGRKHSSHPEAAENIQWKMHSQVDSAPTDEQNQNSNDSKKSFRQPKCRCRKDSCTIRSMIGRHPVETAAVLLTKANFHLMTRSLSLKQRFQTITIH